MFPSRGELANWRRGGRCPRARHCVAGRVRNVRRNCVLSGRTAVVAQFIVVAEFADSSHADVGYLSFGGASCGGWRPDSRSGALAAGGHHSCSALQAANDSTPWQLAEWTLLPRLEILREPTRLTKIASITEIQRVWHRFHPSRPQADRWQTCHREGLFQGLPLSVLGAHMRPGCLLA